MSGPYQLLATASTLGAYQREGPSPLDILRALSYCRHGDASIDVSHCADRLLVTFGFKDMPEGWADSIVRECVVPSVFCFGCVIFSSNREQIRLDAPSFLRSAPESTRAPVSVIGKVDSEFLGVEFESACSAWLSPPKICAALQELTWVGSPTDLPRRRVLLRCIANQQVIEQPKLGLHPHKKITEVQGAKIEMQAVIQSSGDHASAGRVRHVGTGLVVATDEFLTVPTGVAIDIDFEVLTNGSDRAFLVGPRSLQLARSAIASWAQDLVRGDAVRRIVDCQARTRASTALKKLEDRRRDLRSCEYVCHSREAVYRVPTNENQLVALFLKLEARQALPFYCRVLEYTPKSGIDAIGEFALADGGLREMYAPIEFEHEFESFVKHGHPVNHTKLIVCWSADQGRGKDLVASNRRPWLRYYEIGDCNIPVIVVKHLPGITMEKLDA